MTKLHSDAYLFTLLYLLLSQFSLMLPIVIKILILTNKTLPKPFEDGGNELSLNEPMKNSLEAGEQLLSYS